jgi:ADP-heptose:LPS heptosyltransferase
MNPGVATQARSASTAGMYPPLAGVRKIVVLRPNAVGDFVFALPALHALKHCYREAELVFIGKAWHRTFLAGRPGPVDRAIAIPPVPGVGAPPDAASVAVASDFIDRMRAERFDLALQMFGGGLYSNPFLLQFGARLTVGARAADAPGLDRWLPYREPVNRRLALLEIAGLAGAWPGPMPIPELTVTDADRHAAAQVVPPDLVPGRRLVILQPGSTDPRRCWPAERFAALGDLLAEDGVQVAINGSAAEAVLVQAVAGRMRQHATVLAGVLDLGGLCGLLERAALVVSNDTGPLHLALALGIPCVGIFWLTNLLEGMPLRASGLRAALAVRTRCRVCGQDNLARRCVHDASFVDEVTLDEVLALARAALAEKGAEAGAEVEAAEAEAEAPLPGPVARGEQAGSLSRLIKPN